MKFPEAEIQQARDMFTDATAMLEVEGRNVYAFSCAALLAAAEYYVIVHGEDELPKAFQDILNAQQVHLGTAGRA